VLQEANLGSRAGIGKLASSVAERRSNLLTSEGSIPELIPFYHEADFGAFDMGMLRCGTG
jgi:hypothetical protein